MWHDMLLERGDQRWAGYVANGNKKLSGLVSELPKDIIIADWQYGYREGEGGSEPKWPTMDFFHQAGFNVLVCPWIEGKGIRSLGRKAELNGLMGMLETTWHISHDIYQTCIFGQAANAAWNPMAELPHWNSFVLSNALHMRQIGWDMGIAEYEKTGWNMEQVDPGRHPHHLR